jgi:hypothetical protein
VLAGWGFLWCALLAGCHSAHVADPVTSKLAASDPDTQLMFWHTLAERPMTSNDDALHGMLLYLDEKDDCASYADRVTLLKGRALLPTDFNEPADVAVTRGTVAVMFAQTLHLKGGWALHVFSPRNPRYAVRELMYMSIFPYSSPQQTFSGSEFVGVIGALEDYQKAGEPSRMNQPAHTPITAPPGGSAGGPQT